MILADGTLGALASLSSLAALAALKPTWKVSDLKFFFVCKTELKMNEFSDPYLTPSLGIQFLGNVILPLASF